jgi:hypothetical protein
MVNTTTCLTPCQQFLNRLYFLIQLYIISLFIHFMVDTHSEKLSYSVSQKIHCIYEILLSVLFNNTVNH